MRKIYSAITIVCMLMLSTNVFAQTSDQPDFISKVLPPIPVVMSESEMLRISYIEGLSDGANAFSLVFENKTDKEITFTWTLKDKNGQELGASLMTLAPHAKIDYTSKSEYTEFLTYVIDDNTHPKDCTITLSF